MGMAEQVADWNSGHWQSDMAVVSIKEAKNRMTELARPNEG
jgi:hypothetical protein